MMKAVLGAAMLLLVGCGAIEDINDITDNFNHLGAQPAGIYIDMTLEDHLREKLFDVAWCLSYPEPDFSKLSIIMMPESFPCKWHDGVCAGEFVVPNTIKLGSTGTVANHEFVHYLKYLHTGWADPRHKSADFDGCRFFTRPTGLEVNPPIPPSLVGSLPPDVTG